MLKRLAKCRKNMSTIGKNIRKIRTVKKLSQAAFAELFKLARPSVGAYEEERAEPKIETVIQIANHFGISIDSLLTKELTINELYKFDMHADELIQSKLNQPKKNKLSSKSVFVPAAQQIDYLVQLNSKDFISNLPGILIPGFDSESIRAFEIANEEMHDNHQGMESGDIVLGKVLKKSSYTKLTVGLVYVVVTQKEIVVRRLEKSGSSLLLKADNYNVQVKTVLVDDVLEIWEAVGYFSKRINPPTLLSDRIINLENLVEKLDKRLKSLEKKEI